MYRPSPNIFVGPRFAGKVVESISFQGVCQGLIVDSLMKWWDWWTKTVAISRSPILSQSTTRQIRQPSMK